MPFDLPPELEVLHQPVRLRIVTVLHRQPSIGFAALRESAQATAGNLASHLERLQAAGLVRQDRSFGRAGVRSRVVLTAEGARRFERYLALLRSYLDGQAKPS